MCFEYHEQGFLGINSNTTDLETSGKTTDTQKPHKRIRHLTGGTVVVFLRMNIRDKISYQVDDSKIGSQAVISVGSYVFWKRMYILQHKKKEYY